MSFRNSLKWLKDYWPIIAVLGAGGAWAADHYIDDRIDSKLAAVIKRLDKIDKSITVIKVHLGIQEPEEESK